MDFEKIALTYNSAMTELESRQQDLRALIEKEEALLSEQLKAQSELDRLLDLEQQDHISRILDGENAPPERPKRLTRIANIGEAIEGIKLALPVHRRKIESARDAISAAEIAAREAVLPDLLARKVDLLEACSGPLSGLLDALVEVAAYDDLQEQFSGPGGKITITDSLKLENIFSAKAILTKFQKSLPQRFQNLAADKFSSLDRLVAARSDELSAKIGAAPCE